MKHKQSLAGIFCCFILFIVVCLSLVMKVDGAFPASGDPDLGMLFFILPGLVAGFFAHRRNVMLSLSGAILAAPLCFILMRFGLTPVHSFWQELAWLFGGLFWCSLGALCYLFISRVIAARTR